MGIIYHIISYHIVEAKCSEGWLDHQYKHDSNPAVKKSPSQESVASVASQPSENQWPHPKSWIGLSQRGWSSIHRDFWMNSFGLDSHETGVCLKKLGDENGHFTGNMMKSR